MFSGKKVSCIIPAYNEEGRVGIVLQSLLAVDLLDEVVVINDGSQDETLTEIHAYDKFPSLIIVNHEVNEGKAAAIKSGFQKSSGELMLMMDADVVGLEEKHILELLSPHENRNCMTFASLANSPLMSRISKCSPWSGLRVMPRDLFEKVFEFEPNGYSIDSQFNVIFLQENLPIYSFLWEDVTSSRKSDKLGYWEGHKADVRMAKNIMKEISFGQYLAQIMILPIWIKFSEWGIIE